MIAFVELDRSSEDMTRVKSDRKGLIVSFLCFLWTVLVLVLVLVLGEHETAKALCGRVLPIFTPLIFFFFLSSSVSCSSTSALIVLRSIRRACDHSLDVHDIGVI